MQDLNILHYFFLDKYGTDNFYKIDPCGIKGSRVTSVKNLKNLVNVNEVDKVLKRKLKVLFN